jgi:hypothetical protein
MAGETIDLDNILAQATNIINSSASDFAPEASEALENDSLQTDSDDFEEDDDYGQALDQEEPEVKVQTPEMVLASARRIIKFVNKAQKPFLVKAYRSKHLKEGDEEVIKDQKISGVFDNEHRYQQELERNPEFKSICKRFNYYTELIEGIEFTDDEQQSLEEPLAEVLAKWNKFQMTPEMALLMAVAMVMLPRIEPLFPRLFNGVNK